MTPDITRKGRPAGVLFASFLQFRHHRDDHGAALGVFEEIIAHGALHRAAQLPVVPAALAPDGIRCVHGNGLQLLHQVPGLLHALAEQLVDDPAQKRV